MKFNYQARTKTGEIQTGTVEAASREAALALLHKYNLYVTFLEEALPPFYAKKIKIFERISRKDIVLFSRQLSIMFVAKVPLVESLTTLASQATNLNFREKILKISEDVEGGAALSQALSRYPKIFSMFYVAMVKSGEASGKLSGSLEYLANHLEREYYFYSKIKGATLYPLVILLFVVVVLLLMIFFVIPQLSKILEETGQELPTITQLMIGMSIFLRKWSWLLILGLIGFIVFVVRYYRTLEGKKFFDKIFLRVPLIGNFSKMVYLSRLAENLSTLISGGLPIAQSLEMAGEIVGNTVYKNIIFQARDEVRRGETISSVLGSYPKVFPPMFTQMILVGEKTGALDKTLMNVSDFYQKEVDRGIDGLLRILEPVLIIFLGLIVAGLMASILIPLYNMASF